MTKPDFAELVDYLYSEAVQDACGRMYEQGATVVEAVPRPDMGRDTVLIRGWKVSPYKYD